MWSVAFGALAVALFLTVALLLGVGVALLWSSAIEPGIATKATRYLITTRRVLIAQGHEELHLDRSRIVDVIDTEAAFGGRDLFLVLDGPRSRAMSMNGAFDDSVDRALRPVLRHVADGEGAGRILRDREVALAPTPHPV